MFPSIDVYDAKIKISPSWTLDRTTLKLKDEIVEITRNCELSDQTEINAWLTRLRAKRQI